MTQLPLFLPAPSTLARLLEHHRFEIAKAGNRELRGRRREFVSAIANELRKEVAR